MASRSSPYLDKQAWQTSEPLPHCGGCEAGTSAKPSATQHRPAYCSTAQRSTAEVTHLSGLPFGIADSSTFLDSSGVTGASAGMPTARQTSPRASPLQAAITNRVSEAFTQRPRASFSSVLQLVSSPENQMSQPPPSSAAGVIPVSGVAKWSTSGAAEPVGPKNSRFPSFDLRFSIGP